MVKFLKISIIGIFTIVLAFSFHSRVLAENNTATPDANATTSGSSPTPTLRFRQEVRRDVREIKKDLRKDIRHDIQDRKASSSGDRKAMCENHVQAIQSRQANIANRGETMQTRFDKISTLVQKYYTEKLVPAGKTISNYDTLVSDINTKKAALTPLIEKVKTDSSNLTCEKDQAKAQFQTFKADTEALLKGIKAYRQSVMALVRAVRTAAGENEVSPSQVPDQTTGGVGQ